MKLEEINRFHTQARQACIYRSVKIGTSKILRRHLGCNEDSVPQSLDRSSDHILSAVRFSGVEKKRAGF